MGEIIIKLEDINTKDAHDLTDELSEQLKSITGNDGKHSFNTEDMLNKRSVFAVVRDVNGNALGCGALRYYSDDIAELKRMYVRKKSNGIGSELLRYLESIAKELRYNKIILETRVINEKAVKFYTKNNYCRTDNYGNYVGREEAICFEKEI